MKSWQDITVKQAQELFTLVPEDFDDDLDFLIEQIAICEDVDPNYLKEEITSIELMERIKAYAFIKVLPLEKFEPTITLNGIEYTMDSLDSLKLGQMVDIEEYISGGIMENLHNIISCLYIEEGGKHADPKRAIIMEEANMDFVYGNLLFFFNIVQDFMHSTKDCLMRKMQIDTMLKTQTV